MGSVIESAEQALGVMNTVLLRSFILQRPDQHDLLPVLIRIGIDIAAQRVFLRIQDQLLRAGLDLIKIEDHVVVERHVRLVLPACQDRVLRRDGFQDLTALHAAAQQQRHRHHRRKCQGNRNLFHLIFLRLIILCIESTARPEGRICPPGFFTA